MWFEKVRLDEACYAVMAALRMREPENSGDRRDNAMDYDAEQRLLNQILRRADALRRDDSVLDIGCGKGETTRESATLGAHAGADGIWFDARAWIVAARRVKSGSRAGMPWLGR